MRSVPGSEPSEYLPHFGGSFQWATVLVPPEPGAVFGHAISPSLLEFVRHRNEIRMTVSDISFGGFQHDIFDEANSV